MIILAGVIVVSALLCALLGQRRGLDPVSCAAGGLVLGPIALVAILVEQGTPLSSPPASVAVAEPPVSISPELAGAVVPTFNAPSPDKSRSELVAELAGAVPLAVPEAPAGEPARQLSVDVVTEALPADQAQAPAEATMMSCPHCAQPSYVDHYGLCALCAEPLLKLA